MHPLHQNGDDGWVVGLRQQPNTLHLLGASPTCYPAPMSATEYLPVTITVLNITPTTANRVVALADVEVVIEGIAIVVHGVQLRADSSGTEVTLPRYRAADGSWRTAITLPEEVRGPMGDAVIAAGLEAGLLREKPADHAMAE